MALMPSLVIVVAAVVALVVTFSLIVNGAFPSALLGAIAFLVAGLCIAASTKVVAGD